MTPEEKAVIEAARAYVDSNFGTHAGAILTATVGRLNAADPPYCPDCDHDTHRCGGCGTNVEHGEGACPGCTADIERATPAARTSFKAVQVREDDPVWVPATFGLCLAGDRIRIGQEETDVLRCSAGVWFVNASDYWQPTPWKHTELRMDLAANPGWREYPADTPCEVLMSPARRAAFLIMSKFPGTTRVDG